jgi:hypothetical protein
VQKIEKLGVIPRLVLCSEKERKKLLLLAYVPKKKKQILSRVKYCTERREAKHNHTQRETIHEEKKEKKN